VPSGGVTITCDLLSSQADSSSSSDVGRLINDTESESDPLSEGGFDGAVMGDEDMGDNSTLYCDAGPDDGAGADWGMTIEDDANESSEEPAESLLGAATMMLCQ
jgi:hypothetical protein